MSIKSSRRIRRVALAAAVAVAALSGAQAHAAVTTYNIIQVYNQVVYDVSHPDWDTIFNGTFDFDSDTQTVSNLTGSLSQAMDGNTTWVPLNYQLSSVADGMDGLVVTVFKENTINVFAGGGFASTGMMGAVYTYGNYNAFASVYVPLGDLTAALTPTQTGKLAYGDCTSAGLMPRTGSGTICMAGWLKADGTAGGTMRGTAPITQTIAAVPEPESYAMFMAGLGLIGFIARRRKMS